MRDSEGRLLGAVTTLEDVTSLKDTDRFKTQFISVASRKLRDPLLALRRGLYALNQGFGGELRPLQAEILANVGSEAERLNDLFGDTQRWAETLRPLQFTTVSIMVPGFAGSTELDLPVMLSYDLEIGSVRYFAGLESGEIPLLLLFSGTVFSTIEGRLQVQQVPWSKEASYRLPISIWREAIDVHFPNSAWIRMSLQTLDELQQFKTREALPTWDATLAALLARAADEAEHQS